MIRLVNFHRAVATASNGDITEDMKSKMLDELAFGFAYKGRVFAYEPTFHSQRSIYSDLVIHQCASSGAFIGKSKAMKLYKKGEMNKFLVPVEQWYDTSRYTKRDYLRTKTTKD